MRARRCRAKAAAERNDLLKRHSRFGGKGSRTSFLRASGFSVSLVLSSEGCQESSAETICSGSLLVFSRISAKDFFVALPSPSLSRGPKLSCALPSARRGCFSVAPTKDALILFLLL